MINKMRKLLVFGLILILFGAMIIITISNKVEATPNHYVDDNKPAGWYGPTKHKNISAAITAASSGDWIYVYQGTYNERITISKKLKIEGENKDQTKIIGGASGPVVSINTSNVTFLKFTIKPSPTKYGIKLLGTSINIVKDCLISDIKINGDDRGIGLEYSEFNIIQNNTCSNMNYGIWLSDSNSNELINNSVKIMILEF